MLLDDLGIREIVVVIDAGIVDEDVEGVDPFGCALDLRSVGDVERQGRHAVVDDWHGAARSRIYPLRPSSQCLIDERLTDAAVGAGDQDCLIRNSHTALLFRSLYFYLLFEPETVDPSEPVGPILDPRSRALGTRSKRSTLR